jgi:hypothetical protein
MDTVDWPPSAKFVRTELETGITFADIALSARYQDKIDRNTANARKAYDTAIAYMDKLSLGADSMAELHRLRKHLHHQLIELGQTV